MFSVARKTHGLSLQSKGGCHWTALLSKSVPPVGVPPRCTGGVPGIQRVQLYSFVRRSTKLLPPSSSGTRGGSVYTPAREGAGESTAFLGSRTLLSDWSKALNRAGTRLETFMRGERVLKAGRMHLTSTTVSNLCGHGSFVMLALAYMESDVLLLRGYATSGIVLSVLFQFYRPQPLWIPIGWNGLFLLINVTMIGMILKERNDAGHIGDNTEQACVYEKVFEGVELDPVDFVKLMDLADRKVLPKGYRLTEFGQPQEDLYLIVEGTADVSGGGDLLAHLQSEQYVGSMAFHRFMSNGVTNTPGPNGDGNLSSSPVAVPGSGIHGELQGKVIGKDIRSGLNSNTIRTGNGPPPLRPRDSDRASSTTVTATSELVVYSWNFFLLQAFIKRNPLAGFALQKSITVDLSRTVDQSRASGERYRLLLREALGAGEVTPLEKKKLRRYRLNHQISLAEHKVLVNEMGWRDDEFEAGFQGGKAPRDGSQHFLKYERVLSQELAKGDVNDSTRCKLRQFRFHAGIEPEEHLLALNKQGWTADEYEEGSKGSMKKMKRVQSLNRIIAATAQTSEVPKLENMGSTGARKHSSAQ
ncbi:unnamed protein product [Choristocarpus tenellus]